MTPGESGGGFGGGVPGWWWRSGVPRQPASSPATPGWNGDREGQDDSTARHLEVGLTENGEKAAVAAQNP
jgi:hypothetical protein